MLAHTTLVQLLTYLCSGPRKCTHYACRVTLSCLLHRFGRARKEAEEFVRWFEDVYYLKRLVLYGDDVRVLHAYSGDWQVSARLLCS